MGEQKAMADRPLTDYLAEDKENARRMRPQLQIQSQGPITCSLPNCRAVSRTITEGSEWIAVNTRAGTIIGHLICFGINPNGNLSDPAYQRHIGASIFSKLRS